MAGHALRDGPADDDLVHLAQTYSSVWGFDSWLGPGVVFQPAQSLHPDPAHASSNDAAFGQSNGPLQLTPGSSRAPTGSLSINSHSNVPFNTAAVGIAMDGSP